MGVLGAGALALVLMAAGARLRSLLATPLAPRLRLPVDLVLGGWAFAVLALLAGVARLWSAWSLAGVAVLLAATGRYRGAGWRWGPALPAAAAGALLLPFALAPPFFYDALVYHLGLPWQALREGGLRPHPEDVFSAFPPLAQLLNAPLLALGLDAAPALLHWLAFVAAGAALVALARALGAPRWGAVLAGGALPLLPCLTPVPGLPAAEAWCVAATVAAFALLARDRLPPGSAALVGVLAGVAAAARLQGLAWGLVIVAALAARTRRARPVAAAAAGWVAGAAPWWLKNLVLLGEPFAPLGWRREGLETLWRDAGSALHLGGGAAALLQATRIALAPHAAYLAPLLLAAVFAVAVRALPRHRVVAAGALAGAVAWTLTGNLPRFLAVAAALLLALAASAAGRTPAGTWAAALALGATTALGLAMALAEAVRWRATAAAAGEASAVRAEMVVDDPFPAFAAASALPARARVLFVGEPRGLAFPRAFLAPSQHDVSPLRPVLEAAASAREAGERLRRQGITHVLVNWGELARLAPAYPVAPWRDATGRQRWSAFVASLGAPVVDAKGVQVFALPGQSGP